MSSTVLNLGAEWTEFFINQAKNDKQSSRAVNLIQKGRGLGSNTLGKPVYNIQQGGSTSLNPMMVSAAAQGFNMAESKIKRAGIKTGRKIKRKPQKMRNKSTKKKSIKRARTSKKIKTKVKRLGKKTTKRKIGQKNKSSVKKKTIRKKSRKSSKDIFQ